MRSYSIVDSSARASDGVVSVNWSPRGGRTVYFPTRGDERREERGDERAMIRPRDVSRLVVIMLTMLFMASACSHKSPVGVDDPGGGGEPELFFNWLPALLVDQESAQPNHELMQWLDDQQNYPRQDRLGDLQALLDRLGNAPAEYRQHAPNYRPVDEPILDAIQAYVDQARAYLAGQQTYEPLLQRNPN